jgi:hypothetical protein
MEFLSIVETTKLKECEQIIERGLNTFVDVGNALLEIRDNKLYRIEYPTFEKYCKERWNISKMHAYRLMDSATVIENFKSNQLVTFPTSESQARPLTKLKPEEQREAWQRVIENAPDTGITAKLVQSVVDEYDDDYFDEDKQSCYTCIHSVHNSIFNDNTLWCKKLEDITGGDNSACNFEFWQDEETPEPINKPHVTNNSGENEWYTPEKFIEAAREAMGSIDTDPASSDLANQTVKAQTYFTADSDGLTKTWGGNVWMNPPYAQPLITQFTELLSDKFDSGEINQACVLVNNATETNWFQRMLDSCTCLCLLKSRVKFIDKSGNPSGAPLQGQIVLYFGNNPQSFEKSFSQFGKVLYG